MCGSILCYNGIMVKLPKWSEIKNKFHKAKVPAHPMPVALRILFSVVLAAGFAFAFYWFILESQFDGAHGEIMEFINERPMVFWYSYSFVFLLTLLMMSIFWRTCFGLGATFALISIATYANEQKLQVRAAPLLPEDLQMASQAGELVEFVNFDEVARLAIGIILLLIGTWIFDRILRKTIGKDTAGQNFWERHAVLQRGACTLLVMATIVAAYHPMLHHSGETIEEVAWLGTSFDAWNPTGTYERNGLILSFLYSLGSSNLDAPEGYSEEKIHEIYEKYQALKEKDTTRTALQDKVDNVVLVLNESFYDPDTLDEYYAHTGGDVVPNLHKIFEKYPSGYMYSPEYGGGTANVEYAVYTGLSNYWANTIPYSNFASKLERVPGIVSYAKKNNFSATAVHAYAGSVYKRNIVYDRMGYDEFLDITKMTHTAQENGQGYVSDSEVYAEIYDILTKNDGPKLVGAATMQNHSPYESAGYPVWHFPLQNKVDSWRGVESSFESISHADQYLADFLAKLDTLDQKTVVLWFGDHVAGAFDHHANSEDQEELNSIHLTPYFVYANFELDSLYSNAETTKQNADYGFRFKTEGVDLPTVTPNCLANTMYNILDVEKPVVNYLLDDVCAENPILAPVYYSAGGSPEETEALREYELINYDISHGERYWLKYDLE